VHSDKWLWAARFFKTRSLATDATLAASARMVHKGEEHLDAPELHR
jgi:ribosomal 50S subunit-recycling heat shock protein